MSHDVFEDRLRAELRGAAEAEAPAFLDIDPTEVLGTGRRVVRRRRMAVAGGTLAAVAVLGAGSWAVLDGSADRAAPEVPATRTSAPDGVAPDVVSTTFILDTTAARPSYTVRLVRGSGLVSVTSTSANGVTTELGDVGRVPGGGVAAVYARVSEDPFVVVGVVPADANEVLPRFEGGDLGGVTTEEGALPTTSWKAFLIHTEKSPADTAVAGLGWASGGRVYTAAGTELPAARVSDHTVYLDSAGDEVGLIGPTGTARTPLSSMSPGAPPHLATSVREDGAPTVTTFAIVLPITAHDETVEVAPGATLRSVQSAPLSGGDGVAVVAVVEAPGSVSPVTGVRWTVDGRARQWTEGG